MIVRLLSILFFVFCLSISIASGAEPPKPVNVIEVPSVVDLQLPDNMTPKGEYTGNSEYRIGPQDLLEIAVFLNEDLKREVRVNTQGEIALPLIGTVQAGGKTVQELEVILSVAYGKSYLQNPQINVFIKEFTSQRVTIEGAVKKPGIYPIKTKTSLLQAMAMAEGVDQDIADLTAVLVFRTVGGQRLAAKFNLKEIRAGVVADPQIYGDDIVVVGISKGKWAYLSFLKSMPLFNSLILY